VIIPLLQPLQQHNTNLISRGQTAIFSGWRLSIRDYKRSLKERSGPVCIGNWYFARSKVPIAYVFIVLCLGRMCHSSSMTMATFQVAVQQVVRSMDFMTNESKTVAGFAGIHVRS